MMIAVAYLLGMGAVIFTVVAIDKVATWWIYD